MNGGELRVLPHHDRVREAMLALLSDERKRHGHGSLAQAAVALEKLPKEEVEELARPSRLLGVVEAGAASFRDRAGEGELRDGQDRAVRRDGDAG